MSDEKIVTTHEELAEVLLNVREKFENALLKSFKNFFKKSNELNFEIKILSLWILSVKMMDNRVLDLIHRNFYKKNNWDQQEVDIINKRYKSYFSALNRFTKNPDQGFQFGNLVLGNLYGEKINKENYNMVDSLTVFSDITELIKVAGEILEGIEIKKS